MLFQERFNQIDIKIGNVEEQIRQLQEQLSNLQALRQELQSVEQAAQSAIAQVSTARAMINHVDPGQEEIFKAAIMAEFESGIAFLPESEPEAQSESEPEPDEPEPPVDVTVEPESTQENPTSLNVGSAGFNPHEATLQELKEFVNERLTREQVKEYGSLGRKSTWVAAARDIIEGLRS